MTGQRVCNAVTASLLAWGMAAIIPARGRAQETSVLPESGAPITLVGCLQRVEIKGHARYVLVGPTIGPVKSVPAATCTVTGSEEMVRLEGAKKHNVDKSMVGQWIEISGKLEKFENAKEPRELRVKAFRAVTVAAPRAAAHMPAPQPPTEVQPAPPEVQPAAPQPAAAAPTEGPVATTGTEERLPHTASPLPLIGLTGFLALAGGLALGHIGRRRAID